MEFAGLPSWNLHKSIETGNVPPISVPQNYLNQASLLHTSASSLVVIDPTVQNYQQLVAGVQPNSEVLVLDPAKDAIDQITQALLGQTGISSLHLVSHGESGAIQLGETWLDKAMLDRYQTEFKQWSKSFTKDADILIYGCDVALGQTGRSFIDQFSQLTGTQIAASDDLTGSTTLNGNWTLEISTGKIIAPIAFNAETLANYGSILPVDLLSPGNPILVKGSVGLDNIAPNSVSGDGKYVVFTSSAVLSANDNNQASDVFLYDRTADTVTLISHNSGNTGSAGGTSLNPVISFDGNSVAFVSNANDLVGSMTSNTIQSNNVFVWQRSNNSISLVSHDASGNSGTRDSAAPSISDDGSVIAFQTQSQLAATDTSGIPDVYVWQRSDNSLTHISRGRTGTSRGQGADSPVVSGDGNYVAFTSLYANLTPYDKNSAQDIFLWQRSNDTIANLTTTGNSNSFSPVISQDGSEVAFRSDATTFAPQDTNNATDIFVWTRSGFDAQGVVQGSIQLVSVNSTGDDTAKDAGGFGSNSGSPSLTISRNGQAIAFTSSATDLVNSDTNGKVDVFVRNLTTNQTVLASRDSTGTIGNDDSGNPSLSADGTRVTFTSGGTNLVPGDTNAAQDVFVRDIPTGKTFLISRTSTGSVGNDISGTISSGITASISVPVISSDGSTVTFVSRANNLAPDDTNSLFDGFVIPITSGSATLISHRNTDPNLVSRTGSGDSTIAGNSVSSNGRYVVFTSAAPEIVSGDTNGVADVFLRDRQTGTITLISKGATIANGASGSATISADGRYIVFTSAASNLVAGDNNNATDIFWVDTQTQTLKLVSSTAGGTASANGTSSNAVLSANGLFVAFTSTASNLVSTDTNTQQDVFLWNSQDGSITIVSRGSAESDGASEQPVISSDGRYVAFISAATNLVAGDTNGQRDVFVWDRSAGSITLVSRADGANGAISSGDSSQLSMSQNGRVIAFSSNATNLTATPNSAPIQNVFVRNLDTNTTILASANQSGGYSASPSFTPLQAFNPAISGDGSVVAFTSDFGDLVGTDTNGTSDVFLRDLKKNLTTLVSINQTGTDSGNNTAGADGGTGSGFGTGSSSPVISNDGRYVAFNSFSSDLASGDNNNALDVFVRDLLSGTTTLVSRIPSDTNSGNGASFNPVLSSTGNYVAFTSVASDLTLRDLNSDRDVFGLSLGTVVSLSLDKSTTAEGATPTPVNYTVLRDKTTSPLTVKLAIDPSSTVSAADYILTADPSLNLTQTASEITITFASGVAEGVLTLTPIDDTLIEGDEVLNLNLTATPDYAIADGLGATSLTIKDNDAPVAIAITGAPSITAGTSGTQPYTFTVTLSNASGTPVTVDYAVQDVNTTSGSDYTPVPAGTLTFAPGVTSQTITIPVLGDLAYEPDEQFQIQLSNPGGATLPDAAKLTVGTIKSSFSPPTIAISTAPSQLETASPYVFTVTLSSPSSSPVTVNYSTIDGNAIAGDDYTTASGTLTFAPNETSKTIAVPIVSSPTYEQNESFSVKLTTPTNATIATDTATATIVDTSPLPSVSIANVSQKEGNSGTTPFQFAVTLSNPSDQPITINYATADGTATIAKGDYQAATGSLLFAAGETTKTITVNVNGNTLYEPDKTFSVNLTTPNTNVTVPTTAIGVGTIQNDDSAPPTISISPATIVEGGALSFTVSLSGASSNPVSVDFATSDGTATLKDLDYTQSTGTLVFAPNELTKTITVQTASDSLYEPDETMNLTLTTPINATIATATAIGTIKSNSTPPTISIADPTPIKEGNSGTTPIQFTVQLSNPSSETISVQYVTKDGTADVTDYVPVTTPTTITFAPGQTTQTITVQAIADTIFENDATFAVELSNPTKAQLLRSSATVTILNDDPKPQLSIVAVTPSTPEGNSGTTPATFEVSLIGATNLPVTVNYSTVDGTATIADTDYVKASDTLTFAPGETKKTITVNIVGDTKVEGDETFQVVLSNPTNATLQTSSATETIKNDDTSVNGGVINSPYDVLWHNQTTGANLLWQTAGTLLDRAAPILTIPDPNWQIVGTADFNGDGISDLLWQNRATSETAIWQMASDLSFKGTYLPSTAPGWKVQGIADFNRDGQSDILWRNTQTGEDAVWFMRGTTFEAGIYLQTVSDTSWKISTVADFDNDGNGDIFWTNSRTGETALWLMNGAKIRDARYLQTVPDLAWQPVAAGDFNRDGFVDLLWRNQRTGENGIWLLKSGQFDRGIYLPSVPATNWQVEQVFDFNGDQNLDILWHNTATQEVAIWFMNQTQFGIGTYLPNLSDRNWSIKGVGKFDTQSKGGIVLRNAQTGENQIWQINQNAFSRTTMLDSQTDANWVIQGTADFDLNGSTDIFWRNLKTRELSIWLTQNGQVISKVALPSILNISTDWAIQGIGDFGGDGNQDLIWHNQRTGEVAIWGFNGTQIAFQSYLPTAPLNWQIDGIADVNGDRSLDLIWRNTTTGELGYWLFDRTQFVRAVSVATVDPNWKIEGFGDFNRDGQTDLVWRNMLTGETGIWMMNGTQLSRVVLLPTAPLNWDIAGVGDFNGDGQLDLLWRDRVGGANGVWYLNGGNFAMGSYVASLPDLSWQVESVDNF